MSFGPLASLRADLQLWLSLIFLVLTRRAKLRRRNARGQHCAASRERAYRLKIAAKGFERRNRLQVDGNKFGIIGRRAPVNNFDLQPRQVRSRPCCAAFVLLIGHWLRDVCYLAI